MQEIATARLLLRPFTDADVPTYAAIRAQPDVARFLPPRPGVTGMQLAAETVAAFGQCWREQGYGPWAVIERATGRLIGHQGLRYMREFRETEILYALDRAVWGKGYATEGARTTIKHGFLALALERVIAIALPDNYASLRVMAKVGLTYQRDARYKGMDVAYHQLERRKWEECAALCQQ
jgi:ribosomal-protein-alanine N-acetyltransferase